MEIFLFLLGIPCFLLIVYILYLVIEAAVRKGIDNSETGKIIRKYMEVQGVSPSSSITDEEIEKELEQQAEERN
jgi:hypothetical protein